MDKRSKNTKWVAGVASAIAGLIAACTVCCAPLMAPILAGLLAAFGLGAYLNILISWKGLTLIALVGGTIGIVFWRRKNRFRQCEADRPACQCKSKCNT